MPKPIENSDEARLIELVEKHIKPVIDSQMKAIAKIQQAIAERDKFVMSLVNYAKTLRKECREKEAHLILGQAFHPVMDSTSPEHVDKNGNPKPWLGMLRSGVGHSPGSGTPWFLKLIGYEGDENPRDATPEIYYATAAKLNHYYDIYLQD